MSQIVKKLFFWLNLREIVYWQVISSFSTLAQSLHFKQKVMGEGLKTGNQDHTWCDHRRYHSVLPGD